MGLKCCPLVVKGQNRPLSLQLGGVDPTCCHMMWDRFIYSPNIFSFLHQLTGQRLIERITVFGGGRELKGGVAHGSLESQKYEPSNFTAAKACAAEKENRQIGEN